MKHTSLHIYATNWEVAVTRQLNCYKVGQYYRLQQEEDSSDFYLVPVSKETCEEQIKEHGEE